MRVKMSDLYWLTNEQMEHLEPFFLKSHGNGRPLSFFMTAGQISDYTGAAVLLDRLLKTQWLLADRGYHADWFREALQARGIRPCIPGRKFHARPIKHDKRRYKHRNRIEIMFGRLKWWSALRQMPNSFLLGYLSRCNSHVLAMRPEPRSCLKIRTR